MGELCKGLGIGKVYMAITRSPMAHFKVISIRYNSIFASCQEQQPKERLTGGTPCLGKPWASSNSISSAWKVNYHENIPIIWETQYCKCEVILTPLINSTITVCKFSEDIYSGWCRANLRTSISPSQVTSLHIKNLAFSNTIDSRTLFSKDLKIAAALFIICRSSNTQSYT